jgi:Protein phosphatase 2C
VCQDSATCIEVPVGGDSVLVAVVSDGAGSATLSSIGSRLVVEGFARRVSSDLRMGLTPNKVSEERVRDWLDDIREHIFHAARQRAAAPRELAATLVGALVYAEGAIVCHIGDGACVVRKNGSMSWEVPSWPAHGEYASSTYFVTDDPEPKLQFVQLADEISELAIFSDGIERLALDFANKTASERFFDPMFAPLVRSRPGRNRTLSSSLRKYLDSPRIIDRTDDDKSLILARRVG